MPDFLDLTTAVETDTEGKLEVSAETIAVNGLDRNDRSNLYFDYGVGHYNFNFIHRHYVEYLSGLTGHIYTWVLANVPNTAWHGIGEGGIRASGLDGVSFRHREHAATAHWALNEVDAGTLYNDIASDIGSLSNPRYIETYWVEDPPGPNGGGYLYGDVYPDDSYDTPLYTMQLNLHKVYAFQYRYPMMSLDDNNLFNWTGIIGKVYSIGEGVPALARRGVGRGILRGVGRGL